MSINITCKSICASEVAAYIQTTDVTGQYNPLTNNPKTTPDVVKQYNAVGFVVDPRIVVAAEIEAALVGKTDSEIIVAFRGTLPPAKTLDSFLDWLQDFYAVPSAHDYLPGKVHSGFYIALNAMQEEIHQAILTLDPNRELPVYFTGHSKGGGIAPIAAMYFKNRYNINAKQTITIAGPKPGDTDFCNAYNETFPNDLRYENYLDIVPLMPPSDSFIEAIARTPLLPDVLKNLLDKAAEWDYSTVGTLKYVEDSGNVLTNPDNMDLRLIQIAAALAKAIAEGDFGVFARAHHASCGYRYMKGMCDGAVCSN